VIDIRLTVSAIRPLAAQRAELLAERLAATIAGVALEAPGITLGVELGSDADGDALVAVDVEGSDAEAIADELTSELGMLYLVDRGRTRTRTRGLRRHPLVPVAGVAIGFAAPVASAPGWSIPDADSRDERELVARWLDLALVVPGLVLRWELTTRATTTGRPRLVVRAFVLSPDELPVRARALLAERLPDWGIGSDATAQPAVEVTSADVRRLVCFPTSAEAGGLAVEGVAVRPVPATSTPQDGALLGIARHPSGRAVDVRLDEGELARHVHLIGKTGTGKSTAQAALIHAFALAGRGLLLLDPHGELCSRVIATLPEAAADRTLLIDAGDARDAVPFNPFHVDDPAALEIVIQDLVLMFYKLFDPGRTGIVGPRFESLLTNAVRGLVAVHGRNASLLDVPRIFRDRRLEQQIAQTVTDPRLVEFWRGEMAEMTSSTRSEVVGWFTSKFDRFASTQAMRAILGGGADALDPARAMDESRIVLVDLSKRRLGEVASNLLGFLYLTRYWAGFLARRTNEPFGIFVDEVQSFSAGSLPAMLSEGRKWGASVTVAHQFLGQLDPELAAALSGNVATTAAFRSSPADAAELATRLGGGVTAMELATLPDLTALLSRGSGSAAGRPHTLELDHHRRVRERTGLELEEFREAIRRRTVRELVDPHRIARVPPPPRSDATLEAALAGVRLLDGART
jgi:hypothetical protein